VRLEGEPRQLDAERRGLGVHPVRAPDADRVDVRARLGGQRGHQLLGTVQDDLARGPQLEGERGVQDVGGGQAEVDPAAGGAGARAQDVDEGGDVVVGDLLAAR
jgi:hypothetical protein